MISRNPHRRCSPRTRRARATALAAVALLAGCTTQIEGTAVPLPSPEDIAGLVQVEYRAAAKHVGAPRRVSYDKAPPFGGAHDYAWAPCNGVVYPTAVRTEHMVHSLEHGAVWIAYNPDEVSGDALEALAARVTGKTYLLLSPYPGLDQPISVQSWGYQVKVRDAGDPRIDQFISLFRNSPEYTPEFGATCDGLDPRVFDQDDPPPFDPSPPRSGAMPVGR